MRNTGTRGYYGYRGRRPDGKRWLIVALVLILLAACAFLLAQRYIVYDMDGSYHFELPWFRRAESGGTAQESPDAQGEPAPQGTSHQQDLEIVIERPPEPEVLPLRARELESSALGGIERTLSELPPEINAVAVRLKNVKGDLLYPSELASAIEAKAVAGSSIARSALETLTASDYHTIARLSALHDSRFSFAHMTEAAVLQRNYKNYVWYAPDSSFYLAPEKELTRQYLCDIAAEVAGLGFDELLFDEFSYPPAGRLSNINTDARTMTMEEALSLLADNLREALGDSGVLLSLTMDADTVLAGSNEKSGQNLLMLAPRFDRIYVPTTEEQLPELRAAMAPFEDTELVPILKEPGAEEVYLLSDG